MPDMSMHATGALHAGPGPALAARGTRSCLEAIAEVIAADTGADPERALLLASGLTGMAEISARWWLPSKGTVSRDEAVSLLSALAWRGISGFPRIDGEHPAH